MELSSEDIITIEQAVALAKKNIEMHSNPLIQEVENAFWKEYIDKFDNLLTKLRGE